MPTNILICECGGAQAILSPTTLHSDQEDYLIQPLKATASAMGGNIAVRQSPTYSPQSHGSVERFHRTLMGQVRALLQQVSTNYDIQITNKHPVLPWIVQHAAYLLNRYAAHNDRQTSYQPEKTTSLPYVKLVRQYNTTFQQSESYQSLRQGSTMAFGLEETQ